MSEPFELAVLDVSDRAAVAAYERAFYDSFERATANRLVRSLWLWDDERRRLSTRIPYPDQVIHVARDKAGNILAAIAVNVAMRMFQAEAFGFARPCPNEHAAEIAAVFSTSPGIRSTTAVFERAASDLRDRDRRIVLATTAQRPLRAYLRIGWELMGETEIQAELRYLLRFDLRRDRTR